MEFDGIVNGDTIKGLVQDESGSVLNTNNWKAMRDPSTVTLIDNLNSDSDFMRPAFVNSSALLSKKSL